MKIHETNIDFFKTFDLHNLNISWQNVSILDYGCNQGNFLKDFKNRIQIENYTGIDIVPEAINLAKVNYPNAKFVLYNKHNPMYNPEGDKNCSIYDYIKDKFDVIVVRSVYSHVIYKEFLKDLATLKTLLNENGIILFTLPNLQSFRSFYKSLLGRGGRQPISNLSYKNIDMAQKIVYWVNNEIIIDDENFNVDQSFNLITFYNQAWLSSQLPGLAVRTKKESTNTSEGVFSYR